MVLLGSFQLKRFRETHSISFVLTLPDYKDEKYVLTYGRSLVTGVSVDLQWLESTLRFFDELIVDLEWGELGGVTEESEPEVRGAS